MTKSYGLEFFPKWNPLKVPGTNISIVLTKRLLNKLDGYSQFNVCTKPKPQTHGNFLCRKHAVGKHWWKVGAFHESELKDTQALAHRMRDVARFGAGVSSANCLMHSG